MPGPTPRSFSWPSTLVSKRRHRKRQVARRLRLASLLMHPTARRILDLGLDSDPPFLAVEITTTALGPRFRFVTWEAALEGALALVSGLAEAHRMGLVHGGLGEDTVSRQEPAQFVIDWTGLDVGTPLAPGAAAARSRSRGPPRAGSRSLRTTYPRARHLARRLAARRIVPAFARRAARKRDRARSDRRVDVPGRSRRASLRGGSRRAIERTASLFKTGPDRFVHDDGRDRVARAERLDRA